MRVVDLFCGGGGFSEGARRAGCNVVLAVDCDTAALAVHAANHSGTQHVCASLPPSEELHACLATHVLEGAHIHASPPCQKLSQANRCVSDVDVDESLFLVRWYVNFVISTRPTSWTMEQVSVPLVRSLLSRVREAHPEQLDFLTVDVSDFGVPQNRRRIIAGPPNLIERIRRRTTIENRHHSCVRDLIQDAPGTHIQSTTTNTPVRSSEKGAAAHRPLRPEEHIRPVDGPSYTILARQAPWWSDSRGTRIRRLTVHECARLQTFPPEYMLNGVSNTIGQRVVGNAVPPRLATAIMELARTRETWEKCDD